jgi:surface carbohydrate biosynthesis protein
MPYGIRLYRLMTNIPALKRIQSYYSKAKTYFSFLSRAKKNWKPVRKSNVLIYDAEGAEVLSLYLHPWKPEILHVRGEEINMQIFLKSLFRKGNGLANYLDCFIEAVSPRLIVTFIDNSLKFFAISGRHPNIKTLFVQNGVRSYYADIFEVLDREKAAGRRGLAVNYMGTFGSFPGGEYGKYIDGEVIAMGSFKNNIVPRGTSKNKGTIAYISQYRNIEGLVMDGRFRTRQDFFEKADRIVLDFLDDYAQRNGKQLFIVPFNSPDSDSQMFQSESSYYRDLTGREHAYASNAGTGFAKSYRSLDTAEVVVGIDSTLVLECAARGNKTAVFSVRGHFLGLKGIDFGWPGSLGDEGSFWTNQPDTRIFERILDHLFNITDEQWISELSEQEFDRVMVYDPGNHIFNSILQKELGTPAVN